MSFNTFFKKFLKKVVNGHTTRRKPMFSFSQCVWGIKSYFGYPNISSIGRLKLVISMRSNLSIKKLWVFEKNLCVSHDKTAGKPLWGMNNRSMSLIVLHLTTWNRVTSVDHQLSSQTLQKYPQAETYLIKQNVCNVSKTRYSYVVTLWSKPISL